MATPVYEAFIGGVDRAASHVLLQGFSLKEITNGLDTGVFHVESQDASLRPTKRQPVVIKEDGIEIFGGIIRGARESAFGGISADGHDAIVTEIECDHFTQYFTRRFINLTFAGGTLKAFAIAFTAFFSAAPFSVTLDAAQVDGPTLPAIVFENERGDDCLNFVAALTAKYGAPFQWKMDHAKVWGFYQAGATPAPWNLLESDFATSGSSTGDVVAEPTDDTYANKIIVVGGDGRPVDLLYNPDAFVGDGVTNVFPLTYRLIGPIAPGTGGGGSPGSVAYGFVNVPGGAIAPFGDIGVANMEWTYDPVTNSVSRVAGAPALGFAFSIPYIGQLKFTVTAQDAAEIAANGLWEDKIVDEKLEDPVLALERAQAELALRLVQNKIVVWQTRRVPAPRPGDSITVTVPKRNLTGSFTVVDVSTDYEEGSDVLLRTVTLTSSVTEHWRQTLTRWWSPNTPGGAGTMPASGSAAPGLPQYSVQFHDPLGRFNGAEHVLYGPLFHDLTSPPNSGLIFVTSTEQLTDPQRLEMGMLSSGDFTMDLFGIDASILINADAHLILTAGANVGSPESLGQVQLHANDGIRLSPGDLDDAYTRLNNLSVLEGLLGAFQEVTTTPFTIDTTSPSNTNAFLTFFFNRADGTVNLPPLANFRSFPVTSVRRLMFICNVHASGICTLDGNSSENINGQATIAIHPGGSVLIQGHSTTNWRVLASHGNVVIGGSVAPQALLRSVVTLTDSQIKALPSTPIELVAAPGSGKKIKVFAVSLRANFSAGAYTNVGTAASWLQIHSSASAGVWYTNAVVNDDSMTTDLTQLTALFANANDTVMDLGVPTAVPIDAGSTSGGEEWERNLQFSRPDVDGDAVQISVDNGGNGNFTGGHANNVMKVTTYYVIEEL